MSKHTPGPWHWVNSQTDEPFDFDVPWDGYGYPSLRTVAEFGETKSEVIDGQTYSSRSLPQWILDAEPLQHGNDEANARLIAAAPELYDALRELLTDMVIAQGNMRKAAKRDPAWEGCAEIIQPRVDAARAAIAKAEGK